MNEQNQPQIDIWTDEILSPQEQRAYAEWVEAYSAPEDAYLEFEQTWDKETKRNPLEEAQQVSALSYYGPECPMAIEVTGTTNPIIGGIYVIVKENDSEYHYVRTDGAYQCFPVDDEWYIAVTKYDTGEDQPYWSTGGPSDVTALYEPGGTATGTVEVICADWPCVSRGSGQAERIHAQFTSSDAVSWWANSFQTAQEGIFFGLGDAVV